MEKMLRTLLVITLSVLLLPFAAGAQSSSSSASEAPKPLFRDPVHDGAADPTLIYNRAKHQWWMFYTNRRADLATDDPNDVAWVHATRIGIAVSPDSGAHWNYKGLANIPYGTPDYTHWAPDIVYWQGQYHMFLTIVPGTFKDWNAPREIVHLVSPDLEQWKYLSKLEVGSERIIDPTLFHLPRGGWRVWYKDEADHSFIHYADSKDLIHWKPRGVAVAYSMEGPKVFRWKGSYWMITDPWKGLGVYRSSDLVRWSSQAKNILQEPGTLPTDKSEGHHCDVIVHGNRAFIYYFTHQMGLDTDSSMSHSKAHTVLQVAELQEQNGDIVVDRDKKIQVDLGH